MVACVRVNLSCQLTTSVIFTVDSITRWQILTSVKQLLAVMGAIIQLVATIAFVQQVIDWQVITIRVMVSHG